MRAEGSPISDLGFPALERLVSAEPCGGDRLCPWPEPQGPSDSLLGGGLLGGEDALLGSALFPLPEPRGGGPEALLTQCTGLTCEPRWGPRAVGLEPPDPFGCPEWDLTYLFIAGLPAVGRWLVSCPLPAQLGRLHVPLPSWGPARREAQAETGSVWWMVGAGWGRPAHRDSLEAVGPLSRRVRPAHRAVDTVSPTSSS